MQDQHHSEMAGYIELVKAITAASAAMEQQQFDPASLAAIGDRNDELGELARVFSHMVQTVKTHEQELAAAKEQLEAVLNAVPGLISWINADGVYLGVNRHLANAFGMDPEDFVGQEVGFLQGGHTLTDFLKSFVAAPDLSTSTVLEVDMDTIKRYYLVAAQKYQQNSATVSVGIDITNLKLAEEALQQSEARNRAILNAIPDLILRFSRDGTYLDVVEAEGVGMVATRQSRIGRNVRDILPEELADRYLHAIEQAIQTREIQHLEYQLLVNDGLRDFEARVVGIGTEEAILFVRDITDSKQAELALLKSERDNRALLAAIPDLLVQMKGDGTYLGITNDNNQYIVKAEQTKSGNANIYDLLPRDVAEQRMHYVRRALETGQIQVYEQRFVAEGRVIDEEVRLVVSGDDEVLVIIRDITERKCAEEALRIAEENYRSIFENALEGIFQSSREGRFINVNPAMARVYGYDSPQEMLDAITDIATQVYVDPEDQIVFRDQMAAQGQVKNFEYRVYQRDGDIIWIQEDTRAVRDNAGQVLYYEGMIQDITDRKRREDDLRKQLADLKIEIDQKKREKEVATLTESSFFQEVQQEMAEVNLDEFWS